MHSISLGKHPLGPSQPPRSPISTSDSPFLVVLPDQFFVLLFSPSGSAGVVPSALTINQACQFVMAILCVHLGREVQTPQPTFSSSVSSLHPVRCGSISVPLYIWPTRRTMEGNGEGYSLSLSLPLFRSRTVAGQQPAVNVPAATDGISVDGEKEKAPCHPLERSPPPPGPPVR